MKAKTATATTSPRTSMRLRAEVVRDQERKLATWLYVAHDFRNKAVAFITHRRRARATWCAQHPALAKEWIPEEWAGSDAAACSQWLTVQLENARSAVQREFHLVGGKRVITGAFVNAWSHLSQEERFEVRTRFEAQGTHPLWLLLPRTVLDQVVQDLGKTIAKAQKDRAENRQRKAAGLRPKKVAGFPGFQKWSYSGGVRLQVEASKNTDFREGWARGELVLPALGRIKLRESGYAWPKTPAKLITLSREASGAWRVSFPCAPGDGVSSRSRRLEKQGKTWEALPLDASGIPAIEGMDMSLPDKAVSNVYGKLGRKRYLKTCASKLRFRNKALARKTKGSGRWKKAVRALGKLHVKVANERLHENRAAAQAVANRSAIVCVETLQLAFMQRNRTLAQSIHDLGWGQFVGELERAMAARGHLLLYSGQFSPTTQTCPACGEVNRALKNALSIRQWNCPQCGQHHDRDLAAANNIQADALARYLESSTRAESALGTRPLHPELAAFIARGGMTALGKLGFPGSRQVKRLGCVVPENRESCPHGERVRLERRLVA